MAAVAWSLEYPSTGDAYVTRKLHFNSSPANPTCHWRPPYKHLYLPRQILVQTLDGGVRAYEIASSANQRFELSFNALPAGATKTGSGTTGDPYVSWGYLGLVEFLSDLNWSLSKLMFNDHENNHTVVRYVGGIDSFVRNAGGYYSGTIVLQKELL